MTTVHIDEEVPASANMTIAADKSDYEMADWAERRGLDEIWIHDLEDETRVVSYHVDFAPREYSLEELLGL